MPSFALPLGARLLCLLADEDPVSQAFIQRRASLTEKQWNNFLSEEHPQQSDSSYHHNQSGSAKGLAPVKHHAGLLRRKHSSANDLESSGRDIMVRGR